MTTRRARAVLVAGAALLVAGAAYAQDGRGVSEANELLFQTRHLDGLEAPATLHYRLRAVAGADDAPFEDEIAVRLRPNDDGADWHARVEYLSGNRRRHVPPVPRATGNPIIKVFLQREVLAMQERTGGDWRYFQKATKTALEESATVSGVRFRYHGREVRGVRIEVAPYRDDPRRASIGEYAAMRYIIVLSDRVPGQVHELTATTAAGGDPGGAAFAETLRLQRVDGEDG